MRKTRRLAFAIGTCLAVVLSSCGGSESSSSRVKNAALGKPAVVAKGSCDDGEMIEGVDDDDCVVTIKIGKSTRKATLQTLNTDGDWDTVDSVIAKKGGVKFDVPATDDEGVWLDGQYTYRVFAARSGKLPEFISDDFDVIFGSEVATDDVSELGGEETDGVAPEMEAAMADIEKPTTKFDDNCSKIFNKVDCALMFRPGKGPDFATLGKSKWVKMCSTLLSRPEGDCEMEFKFATEMQKSSNPPGYDPSNPNSTQIKPQGLDPVKLAAACAAIGMAEADCRAAIQAGPMAALQKFGDKAEAFCKAYAGKTCLELMASMTTGGAPNPASSGAGQQGTMQPGKSGSTMQPGQQGTMQPGQQGTMQPPTPGKG